MEENVFEETPGIQDTQNLITFVAQVQQTKTFF